MKLLNLQQGSPEWVAARTRYDCASEAPVVMNESPHMTRGELLRIKAFGAEREFSDYVRKRVLDKGHEVEAQARPISEHELGEDLYPATCVSDDDKLLASLDGMTMAEELIFEHKQWNEELAAAVRAGATELPGGHHWQLEHQLLVVPTAECVRFVVSDGTEERRVQMDYRRVPGRAEQLRAGWAQFHADLDAGVAQAAPPKAVAEPVESLPAVNVRVGGELVVASNLADWGVALRAYIERIPERPTTDQDFANTEAACKALKKAEEALESAESSALSSLSSVEELRRLVADLRTLARSTRLQREKMVEARKIEIRTEQIARGKDALAVHIAGLNKRLGEPLMPTIAADFATAIRGKKTVQSLVDSVDAELTRAKLQANEVADRIQINLNTLAELGKGYAFLFSDARTLVQKDAEACRAIAAGRIAEHKAGEQQRAAELAEKERERIRAEEAARLQREQEEAARRQRDVGFPATPGMAAAVERLGLPDATTSANVRPMPTRAPACRGLPTLRVGEIANRLGFGMTAAFLRTLGFEAASKEGAATLYHEQDFPAMCNALVNHIQAVRDQRRAA
jgi:predicted phage-related endonuclease